MNKNVITICFFCAILACNLVYGSSGQRQAPLLKKVKTKSEQQEELKILDTAFQAYLANKSVNKAYEVALKAIAIAPNDLQWRNRLANAASWSNRPRLALLQWKFILEKDPDNKELLTKGIDFAKKLKAYDYQIYFYERLLKLDITPKERSAIFFNLIDAYAKNGDPEHAIALLKKDSNVGKSKKGLNILMNIYHDLFKPVKELNTINLYAKHYTISFALALRKARLLINEGKIDDAFKTLYGVKDHTIKDKNYWALLADLAWRTHRLAVSTLAYEHLYHLGDIDEFHLERLIIFYEKTDPEKALKYAVVNYKKFKSPGALQRLILISTLTKQPGVVKDILKNMPPELRKEFETANDFAYSRINYHKTQGNWPLVKSLYIKNIDDNPDDEQAKIDLLWFLMDREDVKSLARFIKKWHVLAEKDDAFWDAYGSAYIILKNQPEALHYYYKLIRKEPDDYRWYMGASVALGGGDLDGAQTKLGALSRKYREKAWQLLNTMLADEKEFTSPEEANIYAYLAMQFSSADYATYWMSRLAPHHEKIFNSTLMDILFYRNYAQLAHKLIKYYKNSSLSIENWIPLRLALIDGDTIKMAKLLKHHFESLPERDRVIASNRVGQPRLAQSLAFQGMVQKPYDNNLFDIYRDLYLRFPNRWQVKSDYHSFTGIDGFTVNALYQQLIGYHSATIIKTTNWMPKITDQSQFAKAPSVVHTSGVIFKRYLKTGEVIIGAGVHHAFKTNPTFLLSYVHQIATPIQMTLTAGLNQPAEDSTALRLIGLGQYGSGAISFTLTPRDQFSMQFGYHRFYSEDYTYLGDSFKSSLLFLHIFRLAYPDPIITLGVANSVNRAKTQGLSAFTRSIAPPDTNFNTFYLSQGSTSVNASLGVGMKYLEEYTHRWRPFASLSSDYNNQFGVGYTVDAGIAGTVVGRDHLVLFTLYQKNVQEQSSKATLYLGLKYTYYF